MSTDVQAGDLIFTRWDGWLSRLTCWATRGEAAHQELIYRVAPAPTVVAASASVGRMVTWDWESRKAYFAKSKTRWVRFGLKLPLPLLGVVKLLHEAEEQVNTFEYSKGELVLQGIDALRGKLMGIETEGPRGVWARKLGDWWKSGVICSKSGNVPLIAVGALPERASYWSPADTLRYVRGRADVWALKEMGPGWAGEKKEKR